MSIARGGTYRLPNPKLEVDHIVIRITRTPFGADGKIPDHFRLYTSTNYTSQAVALLDLTSAEPHSRCQFMSQPMDYSSLGKVLECEPSWFAAILRLLLKYRRANQYHPQVGLNVHATLLSTISRALLTQTFVKPSSTEPISEDFYSFRLYDGASLVGFTCQVGAEVIRGNVQPKKKRINFTKKPRLRDRQPPCR